MSDGIKFLRRAEHYVSRSQRAGCSVEERRALVQRALEDRNKDKKDE